MDIQIYARNITLGDDSEKYINRKIDRLERHLNAISDAKLEISQKRSRKQGDVVVAQLTLSASGQILRGQETGQNLFAAIDAVTDVMDRQIRRYKTKVNRNSQGRRAARSELIRETAAPPEELEIDHAEITELGTLVRTKRFAMRPMTLEDAISEMEFLSHNFFFFYNTNTKEYNVLYKRQDGDYSVIEPDLTA